MAEEKKNAMSMQENNQWIKEMDRIAEILNKMPLEIKVKWGGDVYTYNDKNIVSYGGFKNFFTIWFYNGVFLKDPYHVLINASEGKTKSLRQWRFTSMDEIDEKKIAEYVYEAIEIEKNGLKISPEKFTPLPIPTEMEELFSRNIQLKNAFEQLTPGKQKEYIIFINEAKQAATKIKRLEKIAPMVLAKQGLNDKYK